jgi:glycosyltransferase involved in cell wall biosynthesis
LATPAADGARPADDDARPFRVLMVTPRYPPYVGGVEIIVHELAQRLQRVGVRVTVLTTDPAGSLPPVEDVSGVTVERVRAWPSRGDFYFAPGIYRTIVSRRDEWDVVHVQSYHTFVAPFAMAAARRAGLPYVLSFHGGGHSSRVRQLLRGVQRRLLRRLVRDAARLVATANFEIDLYGSAYDVPRERFELIPNGVDISFARAQAKPAGALIVSVGRLERYKGHQRMLAALPAVLRARPDARLWILGGGPYEEPLRALAARLGIADRVEIRAIPSEERNQMADALGGAALVVLLSEYETHPLAVLEAVALGRPVLVAATPGLAELAERGLAVSIALESSAEEVAAAVLYQLDNPHVPREPRLLSWEECADLHLRLYRRVCDERRAMEARHRH